MTPGEGRSILCTNSREMVSSQRNRATYLSSGPSCASLDAEPVVLPSYSDELLIKCLSSLGRVEFWSLNLERRNDAYLQERASAGAMAEKWIVK